MDERTPPCRPDGFDTLIDQVRSRLLPALVARWGIEVGSDLCADAEAYAWEHRAEVTRMENPLGYLYRVSQSRSRRYVRWMRRTTFPSRLPETVHEDPQLHETLQLLSVLTEDQRVCVLLVHGFGWTYAEVAALLGVTRPVVNHNVSRGLARLRSTSVGDPLLAPSKETARQENRR
jgi:DNA-directed RNA polymerase specialized sigma24 family protein